MVSTIFSNAATPDSPLLVSSVNHWLFCEGTWPFLALSGVNIYSYATLMAWFCETEVENYDCGAYLTHNVVMPSNGWWYSENKTKQNKQHSVWWVIRIRLQGLRLDSKRQLKSLSCCPVPFLEKKFSIKSLYCTFNLAILCTRSCTFIYMCFYWWNETVLID